ncbi:hypothetical protein DFH08DRAFT_932506 [Mycena albidolilacea]|uniref:Uncharacterized protein n=1 Tax=Mycena albidolilacea TaxID=1033008 RepID=A0AAD7AH83_9AGAR|nr:hypothetical protein DFH08DRAFT_932506 [Mycena albidolilacea]
MSSSKSLLQRSCDQRARRSQQAVFETPQPSSPSLDPTSSPNPFVAPSTLTLPLATRTNQLQNFGEQALKKIKLNTESEAEFRTYIETSNPYERNAMQFLNTLQVKALLSKSLQDRVTTWKSSLSLLNIRKFVWALLLLPNVHWYAGTNENTIIEAMRNSNTPDLPPSDSTECEGLIKDVAQEYSVQRSTLKKKIADILVGKKVDIATLTASLVVHSEHVNATMGLYLRVALIMCYPFQKHFIFFLCKLSLQRLHCSQGHSTAVFWLKIDEQLAELRNKGSEELVSALQIVYEDDIETHGDPAKSEFKTGVAVSSANPKWLRNIHSLAPLIQRFSWRQGTKRRCPAEFDLENTEEQDSNRDQDAEKDGDGTEGADNRGTENGGAVSGDENGGAASGGESGN